MSASYVTTDSARKPPAICLLLGCVISMEIWLRVLHPLGLSAMLPDLEDELGQWWLRCRSMLGKGLRPGFDALVLLVCWTVWKERNCCTFRGEALSAVAMTRQRLLEANEWLDAGYSSLASLAL